MECYNFTTNEEEEDTHNVNILESKGPYDVKDTELELPEITEKVKIKKINIGIEVDPKFDSIGYY